MPAGETATPDSRTTYPSYTPASKDEETEHAYSFTCWIKRDFNQSLNRIIMHMYSEDEYVQCRNDCRRVDDTGVLHTG